MTLIPVNLATEDELSEMALSRVLAKVNRYAIGTPYRRGGYGYLRRTIYGWNRAAKGIPFIVLTDLDTAECPARLITDWLHVDKHPNLLFRIAVREVESWLLADPANLAEFLNLRPMPVPANTDTIANPKAAIVNLARKSRSRAIRDRIVPREGSTAKQGPDYNGCLGTFVRERWDIGIARQNSPSLARTVDRLTSFNPVWL
jgi:hypothetical protein